PFAGALDIDADVLTSTLVAGPAHGTLTVNPDGSFTYRAAADYFGTDSFTYRVTDGQAESNLATVTLEVTPVNDAPTLADTSASLAEDGSLVFNPLQGAADVDGDALTTRIVTGPSHGTLLLNADGSYTYAAGADYFGSDSFSYVVSDGQAESRVATVSLVVTPVNDAPVARDGSATLAEDGSLHIDLRTLGFDVDSSTLNTLIVSAPTHGTLTRQADGSYVYAPAPNYHGPDALRFRLYDGELASNEATLAIQVTPVNDAPTLGSSAATVAEDGTQVLNPLATASDVDGDELTAAVVSGPAHGTLTVNANGTFTYKPTANFNGTDSFTYRVTDGQADSNVATVTLTVTPVNDAPVLGNSSATMAEDGTLVLNPLATASDVDGDPLTAAVVSGPTQGTLTLNANGTFTYKPAADFNGTDSFDYRVSDGQSFSGIATVSITVTAVNDAPVASDSAATGTEDTALVLHWSDFHAFDAEGQALTLKITALPTDGQLQRQIAGGSWAAVAAGDTFVQSDLDAGKLRFVPAANASGGPGYAHAGYGNRRSHYAAIGFTMSDGALSSAQATLSIDIAAIADPATLTLTNAVSTTRELFRTSWESAANPDNSSSLVAQSAFEGWNLVTGIDKLAGGTNGFEIWSSNDQMANSTGALKPVTAAAGDGNNWLELNDAGSQIQTLGIERSLQTQAGATYDLSLDLAGRLGFSSAYTRIGVYVDGVRIAGFDNTSGADALSWNAVACSFIGNGGTQVLRIVTEATSQEAGGRGMMVDNIALKETVYQNRELFRTGWESAANGDNTSTLVPGTVFDGWQLITAGDKLAGGSNGFEVWSTGDKMADASGTLRTVSAGSGNGNNWLEINDAAGTHAQTLGIQRSVTTVAGATYTLSFDLAGRIGYAGAYTQIGVYVDDVKLASLNNTSATAGLDWSTVSYRFTGNGGTQTLRIVGESTSQEAGGRGMMVDDIALTETVRLNAAIEDGSAVLQGIAAALADTDGSETLVLTLLGMPIGSVLSDGTHSVAITADHRVADITGWDTSALRFTPPTNFSGNLTLQVQATTVETATGSRATVSRSLEVQVAAAADLPTITLAPRDVNVSRELLATSWESVGNSSRGPTVVSDTTLECWTLVPPRSDRSSAFEVWSANDRMRNAANERVTVQPAAGNDSNWLALTNGVGTSYQTLGVERQVQTLADGVYTLTLDYAGALGLAQAATEIGVYLDGVKIGGYSATSPNTALDWKALSFQFNGNGQQRSVCIVLEGGNGISSARGAMIDDSQLIETLPRGTGVIYALVDTVVALPQVSAALTDTDGSESLRLEVTDLPAGAVLSDGTQSVTVATTESVIDLTGWNLAKLSLKPLSGCPGSFQFTLRATSTESDGGSRSSVTQPIVVNLLSGTPVATPAGLNPFVTYTAMAGTSQVGAPGAFKAPQIVVRPSVSAAGNLTFTAAPPAGPRTWEEEEAADRARSNVLGDSWMAELEQFARDNWARLVG
ncbi:MAG TPA: tandem-95 repeat protein, partial [Burkholderiaceae bacterium]|nr:tandem-95 repeat protein [Burkholderiaceae bacterium]